MGTLTSGLILTALCFCFLLGLATGIYFAVFLSVRYGTSLPRVPSPPTADRPTGEAP